MAIKSRPIQLVGGSTFGVDAKISDRKIINLMLTDGNLYSTSGWRKIVTLLSEASGGIAGRGMFQSIRGSEIICVVNETVWSINKLNGVTFIGSIGSSSGFVYMDENLRAQICIVDGTSAYIYNRNTRALIKQTMPDWLIPNYVCFQDTYFHIGQKDRTGDGSRWGIFHYETDTTISLFQEGVFQSKPDYARAVVRIPNQDGIILVLGNSSAGIQANVAGDQVYAPVQSVSIDYGVANVATIAFTDNFVVWVAINEFSTPVIMVSTGAKHEPISTDGIDKLLGNIKNLDKLVGFCYKRAGHILYQLTAYDEQDNFTLLYDFNEKAFSFLTDGDFNRHPAIKMVYIDNKTYFLSLDNGALYETGIGINTYNDNIVSKNHVNFKPHLDKLIPRQIILDPIRAITQSRQTTLVPSPYSITQFSFGIKQGNEATYTQENGEVSVPILIVAEDGDYILTEDGVNVIDENETPNYLLNFKQYMPRVDLSVSIDGGVTWSPSVTREMHYVGYRKNILPWDCLGYMNEASLKIQVWTRADCVIGNGMISLG